jgi:hypothetical protein
MTINRPDWSDAERAEYLALLDEVTRATTNTAERLDDFEAKLADAVQSHRAWARDVERACLRRGLAGEIKAYHDERQRALVSHDGRLLDLPKVQSRRLRVDGELTYDRALIEVWTWEQVIDKRAEAIRSRRKYDDRIAFFDRLLALQSLCPESVSPADAAVQLGIDLDDFLGREAAS